MSNKLNQDKSDLIAKVRNRLDIRGYPATDLDNVPLELLKKALEALKNDPSEALLNELVILKVVKEKTPQKRSDTPQKKPLIASEKPKRGRKPKDADEKETTFSVRIRPAAYDKLQEFLGGNRSRQSVDVVSACVLMGLANPAKLGEVVLKMKAEEIKALYQSLKQE